MLYILLAVAVYTKENDLNLLWSELIHFQVNDAFQMFIN